MPDGRQPILYVHKKKEKKGRKAKRYHAYILGRSNDRVKDIHKRL